MKLYDIFINHPIMIIKTILTFFIWFFLKAITFSFMFMLFIINKESNDILNKNNGFYIRAKKIEQIPEEIPILTLFYKWSFNKVFDLTYFKIKNKSKWLIIAVLKNIRIKDLILRIFLISIGLNKLFFKIIKTLWYKENIVKCIFEKTYRENDGKLIIKINNEWKVNGYNEIIKGILKKHNKIISENECENLLKKWIELNNKTNSNKILNFTGISLEGTSVKHYGTSSMSKEKENIVYLTDRSKAILKDFYGRDIVLNNIKIIKESVLLEAKRGEYKEIIIDDKHIKEQKIIDAAVESGFNQEKVDDAFIEKVENKKEVNKIMWNDLKNLGVNEECIEKEQKRIIKCLNYDISDNEIHDIIKEIHK